MRRRSAIALPAPFVPPVTRTRLPSNSLTSVRFFLVAAATRLKQEPGSAFGFIDPNFDQTRCGDVAMLVTHVVRFAETSCQGPVVLRQLSDHVQRFDVFRIIIEHALSAGNVANRFQCKPADLSNPLRDWVSHGEKLVGMFVEE